MAAKLYASAIEVSPRAAAYHHGLGNALAELGRPDEAIDAYRAALRLEPDHAAVSFDLGNAFRISGRLDEAAGAYRDALRIRPDFAEAQANLGVVLKDLLRFTEAVTACNAAIRIRPDSADFRYNLGNVLAQMGRYDDAATAYRTAVQIRPDFAQAHANMANALKEVGRLDAAIAACETAIRLAPGSAEAHVNLGTMLRSDGRYDDALVAYETALRINPTHATAYSNLGNVLNDLGRHVDAITAYRTAIRLRPELPEVYSNLLVNSHYQPDIDPRSLLDQARDFAGRFENPVHHDVWHKPDDPDRRLRIGYVSGDFASHPVGHFLRPILASHDSRVVEVFCYSNHPRGDDMTAHLQTLSDHWRSLVGLPDAAAAALVQADRIDILVDLSGHTGLNRLPMFALRPAPVQVSWLGYWGTTGLSRMDFILSDAETIQPDEDHLYSEQVIRLPGSRFCYVAPEYAPDPAGPPSRTDAPVTFGSFNNLAKLGPGVVRVWAEILAAVPGSRLVLKWASLSDPRMRMRMVDAFAAAGLESDRLELRPASSHQAMFAEYGDIDVALDPWPFSGGLTSCEVLWMGVPIVTMPGRTGVSRQTAGFLRTLDLTDWIAASEAEYVQIARQLAADPAHLARLRHSLRPRMAASALCDAAGFTRGLEAAYRTMWQSRAEQPG
ncbi:tetratricopeptide repeat protein [Lichenicola sp.]|uniref:O-linked N-acetylglucosamine transferase, SPINDLY family protein n=1 Tax=Lichenicola sp. TaxID=2804529 RepID=UPI003B00ED91